MLFLLLAVLLSPCKSDARVPMTVESAHLGGGVFRYVIRIVDDPFFRYFNVSSFGIFSAAGVQSTDAPSGWTNDVTGGTSWTFAGDVNVARPRPYEVVLYVRSSHSTFKKVTQNGAYVVMLISTVGGYHGLADPFTGAGYWSPEILVPCAPEEADGSAPNLVASIGFFSRLPDIKITGLLQAEARPVGISYSYPEPSTVRLEATRDFKLWTNVAYIYGTAGATTWTNSSALDLFGGFYRVRLVAEGHLTPLPPLNSATPVLSAAASLSQQSLSGVRKVSSGIEATFASVPGTDYRVELLDDSMNTIAATALRATETTSRVVLRESPTGSGMVRVVEVRVP